MSSTPPIEAAWPEPIRALFESVPNPVFIADASGGLLAVNHAFEILVGRTRDELLGQGNPVFSGTAKDFEVVLPDGSLRYYHLFTYSLASYTLAIAADLTARVKTEAEARALTTRAPCLLWNGTVTDNGHGPGHYFWEIQVFDEKAAEAFWPLEREPGENYLSAWYRQRLPEGRHLTDIVSAQALQNDLPFYRTEFRCRRADGDETGWFDEQVHVERLTDNRWRVAGVCTNITERREVENARRLSEERYRSLVAATAQIVWTTGPDGDVEDMPLWREFTGQSQHEVQGRGWLDALHPDDQAATAAIWKQAIQSRALYTTEYRVRRHDGVYRDFAVRGIPVLEGDGQIREWVGTCNDITETKAARSQQEMFVRDVLLSVTEGRLHLCARAEDLPPSPSFDSPPLSLTAAVLCLLRQQVKTVAEKHGFSAGRWHDLASAASEAAMNAVVHANGGEAQVGMSSNGTMQVRIVDTGTGIALDTLHRATLERGWTTAGSLGCGFWLMLKTVDRVWLWTGPQGTTLVLEQDREVSSSPWLRETWLDPRET